MPTSCTKKAALFPGQRTVNALADLRDVQPRAVIGQRLRTMSPHDRRKLPLSTRQTKALCGEDHNPQLETACDLAKADPVIRAKIILDCLPEEVAAMVVSLALDDLDANVEFYKTIIRSVVRGLE